MTNGNLKVGITLACLTLCLLLLPTGAVTSTFYILISSSFEEACNDIASYYTGIQRQLFNNDISVKCTSMSLSVQLQLQTAASPQATAAILDKFKIKVPTEDVDKFVLYILRTPLIPSELTVYSKQISFYPMLVNGMMIAYSLPQAMMPRAPPPAPPAPPFTLTQELLWKIFTGKITKIDDPEIALVNPKYKSKDASTMPPISFMVRPARHYSTEILVKFLRDYADTHSLPFNSTGKDDEQPLADCPAPDFKPPHSETSEQFTKRRQLIIDYPQTGSFLQYAFDRAGAACQNPKFDNRVAKMEAKDLVDMINNPPKDLNLPWSVAKGKGCRICLAGITLGNSMAGHLSTASPAFAVMGQEEVVQYGLDTVWVVNKDGLASTSNQKSTQSAIDHSTGAEGESIVNRPGKGTYPLLDYTYIGVSKVQIGANAEPRDPPDCDTLANALHFLNWMIADSNDMSRQILLANFFVMGPESRYSKFRESQKTMRCGQMNMLVHGYIDNLENREKLILSFKEPETYVALFLGLICGIAAVYFLGKLAFTYINRLHRESLEHFSIKSRKIRMTPSYLSPVDRFKGVVASRKVVDRYIPTASIQCISTGTWGDIEVFLRPCSLVIHRLRHESRMKILEMMEELRHPHVVPFFGMTELQQGRCLVCSFCPFGDLRTLIIAKHYEFSMNTKFSLAGDIAEGMEYIHKKGFVHGNLRSCAVYIEADWTARVSDYEYDTLHQVQGSFHPTVIQLKQKLNLYQQTSLYPWLYWTSPEILRQGITGREVPPEKSTDVYSFGIVCAEIFSMTPAYQTYQELPYKLTPAQILNGILSADMRPRENWKKTQTPHCVLRMLEFCWQEDAANRPNFDTVRELLRSVRSLRRHVADKIMIAAEKQCEQLDRRLQAVDGKFRRLDTEFHKLSQILLPPAYWRTIYKQKLYTTMTRHDLGIIFYCTLVAYDSIITPQRAIRALECLNLLHKGFQDIIECSGRVYRMYRNGTGFVALGNVPYGVKEDPIDSIARLAFDFMTWAWRVKVPANLMDGFQLQMGIHSGPMAAGTLKYSTNQYTPLGRVQKEAWNISRSSAPCRVLISEDFHQNLRQLAQIFIKYRIVPNKDKIFGYRKQTYWLVGMNYYRQQSLLDDIFQLDPENLEAAAKLRAMELRERIEKKGILRNELVKVVSALPFDYQALKAGGQQYIVDIGDDRQKRSQDNLAPPTAAAIKEAMSIQLVESFEEAEIILETVTAIAQSTVGHRATPATQKLIDHENKEKEVKKVSSLSDAEQEAKKYEEQALRHLRHMKKQEQELLEQKKGEQQHLIQLQHELTKVANQAEETTKAADLVELEKHMDQEITIRVPNIPVVDHNLGKTEHAPPEHKDQKGEHGAGHDAHGPHHGRAPPPGLGHPLAPRDDLGESVDAPPQSAEEEISDTLAPQKSMLLDLPGSPSTLSVVMVPSTEATAGGLQRMLRAAAAEYVPPTQEESVVTLPATDTPDIQTIQVQPIRPLDPDDDEEADETDAAATGGETTAVDGETAEEDNTAPGNAPPAPTGKKKKRKRKKQSKRRKDEAAT